MRPIATGPRSTVQAAAGTFGSRDLVERRTMIVREQEEEGEKRVSKEDRDTPTCGVEEYRCGLKMGLPGC